ncbi:hypothetical protein PR202_ga30364 [Eleusine coracana subsp. coracana]|uniref:Uncharacterized protein n=1 Tax=Eleusine coracana subsp. coracana TaxID=191504 RepID=A0AAV5DP91_ELECO|nr:hypothetical protein PR202_ga30364 [Eleusine coracana subsp. coracana]
MEGGGGGHGGARGGIGRGWEVVGRRGDELRSSGIGGGSGDRNQREKIETKSERARPGQQTRGMELGFEAGFLSR